MGGCSVAVSGVPWWAGKLGLVSASAIVLIMLGAPFVMEYYGQRLRDKEVEVASPAVEAEDALQRAIAREVDTVAEFQLTGKPEYTDSGAMYRSNIMAALDRLTSLATSLGPQSSRRADAVNSRVTKWLGSVQSLQLTQKRYPASEIPGLLLEQTRFARSEADAESNLHEAIHAQMYLSRNRVRDLGRLTLNSIFALGLLGAVLIILIARLVSRLQQETAWRAQILRVVSHDLRNPLTTIRLCSETLLANPKNVAQERTRFLQMIRGCSDRMNTLIADLIDENRTAMGLPLVTNKSEQDIRTLINEVCERTGVAAEANGINVNCRIDASCTVMMDRDRILQVMSNLVDNALRHTGKGGYVEIGSKFRNHSVEFYVLNTGEPVDINRIQRLFRGYRQSVSRPAGLGLGLTISREIVRLHGGQIWAENRNEGPAFCFTLPRIGQNAAA